MQRPPNNLLLTACLILSCGASSAATLSSWTATKPITNETTDSPTLGNNTNGGASAIMYASFPTITLTNVGDALTLSGSFTIVGGVAGTEQAIRFGLFDNNGSTTALNWRGYLGTNRTAANNANGSIFERANQTTGDFLSTTSAGTFLTGTTGSSTGTPPASGTFSFSETITKTATGVSMSFSLTELGGFSWTATNTDTTPNGGVSTEYDRVGIGFSGAYSADQAVFSNITVVPEPTAVLLGGLGMLALMHRRRA